MKAAAGSPGGPAVTVCAWPWSASGRGLGWPWSAVGFGPPVAAVCGSPGARRRPVRGADVGAESSFALSCASPRRVCLPGARSPAPPRRGLLMPGRAEARQRGAAGPAVRGSVREPAQPSQRPRAAGLLKMAVRCEGDKAAEVMAPRKRPQEPSIWDEIARGSGRLPPPLRVSRPLD